MCGKGGIKGRKGRDGNKEKALGGRIRDLTHGVGGKVGILGAKIGKGHKGAIWVTGGTKSWKH